MARVSFSSYKSRQNQPINQSFYQLIGLSLNTISAVGKGDARSFVNTQALQQRSLAAYVVAREKDVSIKMAGIIHSFDQILFI